MRNQVNRNKPIRTWKGRMLLFGILIVVAFAATGAIWYWNAHKREIIKDKLETAVAEKSSGLYNIKYDGLALDEVAGYLSISNLKFSYDSSRYMDLKKQGEEPSFLLTIHIPEISVSGVRTPRALIEKEIVGRKLEIKNPVINILYASSGKESPGDIPSKSVYKQILGKLDLIQADTIIISGAQVTTTNRRANKTGMQMKDVFVTMVDVKVDSAGNADPTRILFAKEVSINSNTLAWTSDDKLYKYHAGNLSLNSGSRQLWIKSFRVVPSLTEEAFVKAVPTQTDRFDFSASNILFQNLNLQELVQQKIVADNLLLPGMSLKIYRDLAIPRDTKNRVGSYPHQLLQSLPITLGVKKIIVTNGFIEYKEKHHISREAGKVQYYNVDAQIGNITNDKKIIAANNVMTIKMNSSFLNKCPFKINGRFYLLHPKGRFELDGSLGAMNAILLNPLIEKTGMTSIEKGKINGAAFNIKGDDLTTNGQIKLLYEDLKVAALEKDRGASELDKKAVTSFFANIAIKNSNPRRNEAPREAEVYLDRDVNRSFFHFAWKTLLKGVTESVGLK